MSGVWEPTKVVVVTKELLGQYVELAGSLDLDAIQLGMPDADLVAGAALMKLQAADWQVAEELDDAEIEQLIRFFTKAEGQLAGWAAGKTSPVIYLAKILKRRHNFDPELKQWIKRNTDNRFLPNGAITL